MKNKLLILMMISMISLMIIPFVFSEVNLWNTVIKDQNNSLTKYHAFYYFDDTSLRGIGKNKDIPIILWYEVQSLPFALTNGTVDWCNLTITQFHNIYGTTFIATKGTIGFFGGELINTTTETQSLYFDSGFYSGKITVNMRDKDSLTADMTCHYTDPNYLYENNILVGRFTTYMPSFECEGCTQYSMEEQSNQVENQDIMTSNELSMYDKIQTAIGWNFEIWLILSWIIKIGFVFIGLGLIFASVYWVYKFLEGISRGM